MTKRGPKPADRDRWLVTGVALAEIVGVAQQNTCRWNEQGIPREGQRYYLPDAIQWILGSYKGGRASSDARTALYEAQCESKEIENAKSRGELIEITTFRSGIMQMASLCATGLESVPARVLQRILALLPESDAVNQGELLHVILDECRAVRSELARSVSEHLGRGGVGEDSDGDPEPAAATDSGRVGRRKSNAANRVRGAGKVADKPDAVHEGDIPRGV